MKLYSLILVTLFLCFGASSLKAQNVNIPDAVFKNYLLSTGVNANLDFEIQLSEAQNYTGAINIPGQNITDLTGLEEFINLTILDCRAIGIATLDISANTMLTSLSCGANPLTSLDLSNNVNLTNLECTLLDITYLDLTNNVNLTGIDCRRDSLLTTINLRNGNNTAIMNFLANDNPALTCIEVDSVAYSTANWTDVDPGVSFSTNCFTNITRTDNISNLQFYPNPTQKALTVNLGEIHSSVKINISNTIGQRIQSLNYKNTQMMDLEIDGLAGWYFIQIETEKGSKTIKVLKQ